MHPINACLEKIINRFNSTHYRYPDDACCKDVPEGMFCKPDALNMTEKTPRQLKQGCERFRFISGIDETAGNYEIGLWLKFKSIDGFPTGCEGFKWKEGAANGVSSIEGTTSEVRTTP